MEHGTCWWCGKDATREEPGDREGLTPWAAGVLETLTGSHRLWDQPPRLPRPSETQLPQPLTGIQMVLPPGCEAALRRSGKVGDTCSGSGARWALGVHSEQRSGTGSLAVRVCEWTQGSLSDLGGC